MKNQLKTFGWIAFISISFEIFCGIQKTQIGKNLVIMFAIFSIIYATAVLYSAMFIVNKVKNKQLEQLKLRAIKFYQYLPLACGSFCLGQFWLISHDTYEYLFLIIWLIAIVRMDIQFDNEQLKNNLK